MGASRRCELLGIHNLPNPQGIQHQRQQSQPGDEPVNYATPPPISRARAHGLSSPLSCMRRCPGAGDRTSDGPHLLNASMVARFDACLVGLFRERYSGVIFSGPLQCAFPRWHPHLRCCQQPNSGGTPQTPSIRKGGAVLRAMGQRCSGHSLLVSWRGQRADRAVLQTLQECKSLQKALCSCDSLTQTIRIPSSISRNSNPASEMVLKTS